RQHASRYLRRVVAGESFQVTERGRPVAVLIPTMDALRDGVRALVDELVAAGRYPSTQAALEAGVDALAHDIRGELVDTAITRGYARWPDEPDAWVEEAAAGTFREMDEW
ncbi:MAG: type II toxin-antitoxin system prevent-host-death family antitoxin, partial [Acidimicrobiia bacterium]